VGPPGPDASRAPSILSGAAEISQSMIPKSGNRFSEKIMLKQKTGDPRAGIKQ
jgi:hypothetical protein